MIVKMNLLVRRAANPDKLRLFYQALGAVFVPEQHGKGSLHYSCRWGDLLFEIYPATAAHPVTQNTRWGFQIEGLDAAVRAGVVAGGQVLSLPKNLAGERHAVMTDPEGHTLELTEPL
jgi:hypothetical protein